MSETVIQAITCTGTDNKNQWQKKSSKLTQKIQITIINYLRMQTNEHNNN